MLGLLSGTCPVHGRWQLFAVYVLDKDGNYRYYDEKREKRKPEQIAKIIGGKLHMECVSCQCAKWEKEKMRWRKNPL